jgi:uncharacterized protein
MRPSEAMSCHREAIRQIVSAQHARNARVFGSASRGEDLETSDLDILVDSTPETTLMDIARIQVELGRLLQVRVDVFTPNALPEKFRYQVLENAVLI